MGKVLPVLMPTTLPETLSTAALLLLCLFCFLSPPSLLMNNIQTIKSSLVIAFGCISWLGILVYRRHFWPEGHIPIKLLLGLFTLSMLLTTLFSESSSQSLFGAPFFRISTVFILSTIGIGLVLRKLDRKIFLSALYFATVVLAFVSIPYNLLFIGSLLRLSGPLRQPDFLAVWLGCGFLIGLFVYGWYPKLSRAIAAGQGLLLLMLLLTETRTVILIVPLLTLIYVLVQKYTRNRVIGIAVATGVLLILFMLLIRIGAVQNYTHIAQQDMLLRAHLQTVAIRSFRHMPMTGYGPGNIVNVLACPNLRSADLAAVCARHLVYTSSHNIFIDRLLEFGWFGGLFYIALTVYAIIRGFRARSESGCAISLCLLLIAFYYLTNITTTEVELLYWILLMYLLFLGPLQKQKHSERASE